MINLILQPVVAESFGYLTQLHCSAFYKHIDSAFICQHFSLFVTDNTKEKLKQLNFWIIPCTYVLCGYLVKILLNDKKECCWWWALIWIPGAALLPDLRLNQQTFAPHGSQCTPSHLIWIEHQCLVLQALERIGRPSTSHMEFEKRDNMCVRLGCLICDKQHHTAWQIHLFLHTSDHQQSCIFIQHRHSFRNYFYLKPTTFMSLEQSPYHLSYSYPLFT